MTLVVCIVGALVLWRLDDIAHDLKTLTIEIHYIRQGMDRLALRRREMENDHK